MAHIIAQPCIGTKDTACVAVCPVDCIHPTKDSPKFADAEMLYIDPDTCIDCGLCVDECPVKAIFPRKTCRPSGPSSRPRTPSISRSDRPPLTPRITHEDAANHAVRHRRRPAAGRRPSCPAVHAADAATPATQPAAAVNAKCPVSGDDVDPKVTTAYQGKTYAFCCADCVKSFEKDPAKYAAKAK